MADFFADLRTFVTVGVGAGLGTGSALERMLEKAMGSAGLLGVDSCTAGLGGMKSTTTAGVGSCLTGISGFAGSCKICGPPPIFIPFGRDTGEGMEDAIRGDCEMDDGRGG